VSRSGGLLRLEASRARISQSNLKIDGGSTTGGACGTILILLFSMYYVISFTILVEPINMTLER
jgi:hypothetical protein